MVNYRNSGAKYRLGATVGSLKFSVQSPVCAESCVSTVPVTAPLALEQKARVETVERKIKQRKKKRGGRGGDG